MSVWPCLGKGVSITIGESWETALALSCGQLLFLTLISPNILKIGNLCMDDPLKPLSKDTGYDSAPQTFK